MSLCWKCKDYYKEIIPSIPWIHCHHDEPEVKPKEPKRCDACEEGFDSTKGCYAYMKQGGQIHMRIIFCPECGRQF